MKAAVATRMMAAPAQWCAHAQIQPPKGALAVGLLSLLASFAALRRGVGGTDWLNYLWAARTALAGHNPYLVWAHAMATLPPQQWPGRADLTPLQLALYVAAVGLGGPLLLLSGFVLAHALTAAVLYESGRRRGQPVLQGAGALWAAGPMVTQWYITQASNKTYLAPLAVGLILAVRASGGTARASVSRDRWALAAVGLAAILGNLTWLGFAALPVLAVTLPRRLWLRASGLVVLISALSSLPYCPSWRVMYAFRFGRVALPGFHTSPLRFVDHLATALLGHSIPLQVPGLLLLVLIATALAWRHPHQAPQCCALAMVAMALWRTDADPPTALLCVVLLLAALGGRVGWRGCLVLALCALGAQALTTPTADALGLAFPYGSDAYVLAILTPAAAALALLGRDLWRTRSACGVRRAAFGRSGPCCGHG